MQHDLNSSFRGITGVMMTFIAGGGLIWISQLNHPASYKLVSSGIWLVLSYAALVDWKTRLMHDSVFLLIGLTGALYCFITNQHLIHWGMGAGLNALALGLVYMLSNKSIGLGDVMLIIALGVFLGPLKSFYLLFYASCISAAVAIAGIILKRVTCNQEIPFIPYIAAGYMLAISSI